LHIQRGPKSEASAHFCFYLPKALTKSDNFGTHEQQFIANTPQQTLRTGN